MHEDPDVPPVVYHYCTVDAFRGILTSKQLWLSDVRFMNDATEQTHFIDMATDVLQDWPVGPDTDFIKLLIKNFEWMRLTPYAFCFCEDGDLLSQWCRYPDDGNGFAVGFSSARLPQQRRKYAHRPPLLLSGVEYDAARQLKLATDCIHEYLKKVPGLNRAGRRDVSMWAIAKLWVLSALCKHFSFHEEKEVRLILVKVTHPESQVKTIRRKVGVSPICHRLRGTHKVPYFRLRFSEQAIAEIRLGPTNEQRDHRGNLEMFLKDNGYDIDHIRIETSKVPYRRYGGTLRRG